MMFGKKKDTKDTEDFRPASQTPIVTERKASPKPTRTVIGENISIVGDIRGGEDLVMEGAFKGAINLEKHHLTIGSKGDVEAEIKAEKVTISGRLIGKVEAVGKVAITSEAGFMGDIRAGSLSVEDGAYLKASIDLEKNIREERASKTDLKVASLSGKN